jgi:hypothetical protein
MLSGKKCGTIIYDSKDHEQFRTDHVTKLRADQLKAYGNHDPFACRLRADFSTIRKIIEMSDGASEKSKRRPQR